MYFHIDGFFNVFIFFEMLILIEEKIGVDLNFIIQMEPILLLDILGENFLVVFEMVVENVLFFEGLPFDLFLIFEDLVDG